MKKLDAIDKFIISEMIKDGRIKYTALAEKLKVTPAAIKERVEKLLKLQIIKPSVLLNQAIFSPLTAIIGVEADSECIKVLAKKFKNCPLVISFTRTSGMHNLILHVATKNIQQLESFLNTQIRAEPGIRHVEVNIGDASLSSEFVPLKIYYLKNPEYAPCGKRYNEEGKCLDCPIFEGKEK
jgi:DNA-binding Lrp family transcriptional regulator